MENSARFSDGWSMWVSLAWDRGVKCGLAWDREVRCGLA